MVNMTEPKAGNSASQVGRARPRRSPSFETFQDIRHNSMMILQLLEGKSWANVTVGGATPLRIMSIDTGAGAVTFPGGVEVAVAVEDKPRCDDSCTFADDGQCDEPGQVDFSSLKGSSSSACVELRRVDEPGKKVV